MSRVGFVTGLSMSLLLGSACEPSDDAIQDEIDDASYCSEAHDCVEVGTECPFGCNIVVNAAEADHIRSLLEDHDEGCYYDCMPPGLIGCVEGRCTMTSR